jgi:hypothetical protein
MWCFAAFNHFVTFCQFKKNVKNKTKNKSTKLKWKKKKKKTNKKKKNSSCPTHARPTLGFSQYGSCQTHDMSLAKPQHGSSRTLARV